MSGRYGTRPSQRALELGDYEEAVALASDAISANPTSPGARYDRARAHELLEAYEDAVTDMLAAVEHNRVDRVIDAFELDDALFGLLIAAAQHAPARAGKTLAAYAVAMPEGQHLGEVAAWQRRLLGLQPTLLDKTVPLGRA